MMIRAFAALAIGLMLTPSAYAVAACYAYSPGVHVTWGVSVGGSFTQDDQDKFNMMQLRRMGVDATRVEMWDGCVRAFVRKPGGGEEMQLFHPETLQRVM